MSLADGIPGDPSSIVKARISRRLGFDLSSPMRVVIRMAKRTSRGRKYLTFAVIIAISRPRRG